MASQWIGKHWMTGKVCKIRTEHGKVVSLEETQEDQTDRWIAPGLIDVQLNGIGGFDINSPDTTVQTIKQVVETLYRGGVTRFCPTVVTGTKERMLHSIQMITEACETDPEVDYAVLGIHVEGPFISHEDGPRGAHGKDWVRDPDWDEFAGWQEMAKGRIRKVTLAPEKPGAIAFIKKLVQHNVVAAIGHTSASEEDIQQAVNAGATMSTHLGNGAHPYIKRHPNYIWSQLASEQLWAGLIADGHHLPPSTLKVMVRFKGRKAIITSDAVHLAGLQPGTYPSHINGEVILEPDGLLHLAHTKDIMAGSATPLHIGVQNVAKFGICGLGEAINLATLHPAELFGLDSQGIGTIAPGSPADFMIYRVHDNHEILIQETVSNGNTVYSCNSSV